MKKNRIFLISLLILNNSLFSMFSYNLLPSTKTEKALKGLKSPLNLASISMLTYYMLRSESNIKKDIAQLSNLGKSISGSACKLMDNACELMDTAGALIHTSAGALIDTYNEHCELGKLLAEFNKDQEKEKKEKLKDSDKSNQSLKKSKSDKEDKHKKENSITIISSDKVKFELSEKELFALDSKILNRLYEKSPKEVLELNYLNSLELKKFFDIFKIKYESNEKDVKLLFDSIFKSVELNINELENLILKAYWLDCDFLQKVIANKFARCLCNYEISSEQIMKMFGQPDLEHIFVEIYKQYYLNFGRLPGHFYDLNMQIQNQVYVSIQELLDFGYEFNYDDNHSLDLSRKRICDLNGIKNIKDIVNCRILLLNGNYIKDLDNQLSNLPILYCLNLSNNCIENLNENLANLNTLEKLILDNNQLTFLGNSLKNLRQLRILSISSNRLQNINNAFMGLTELFRLCLDDNRINSINNAFSDNINLSELYLNRNLINNLGNDLINLVNLNTLWLNHNPINNLGNSLNGLNNLTSLFLPARLNIINNDNVTIHFVG